MKNILKTIITLIASILSFLYGSFDFLLKTLLSLMLIDYITGVSSAFITKKVNSSIGGKGIIKKFIYLCVVAVGVILDNLLSVNGALRGFILYSFIFNEMLSILENCSAIGIKIPSILYRSLEKLNEAQENKNLDDINMKIDKKSKN